MLATYALEELMIEYLEDLIEIEPREEFPQAVQASGKFAYRTGDAVVDRWQEKLARGEHVDFAEAFTSGEAKAAFARIREKSKAKFEERAAGGVRKRAPDSADGAARVSPDEDDSGGGPHEDVHDDYTSGR